MTVLHADRELAARLEALAAAEMRRFVATARALDSGCDAGTLDVAGGVAGYLAAHSPVNGAVGLGFSGAVTSADIEAVERFFEERNSPGVASVCPLADPSLTRTLSSRGWVVDGFENVLVRRFADADAFAAAAEGVEIVEATTEEERQTWALVAATGFSDPLPPLAEQLDLAVVVASRPQARLFLAMVDGNAAGTGELMIDDGVAWLSADTTLPLFRGRGVQQSLQRHRLRIGAEAGCDIAVSEASPGSVSQRNQERAGFRIAYTRVDLVRRGARDVVVTRGEGT